MKRKAIIILTLVFAGILALIGYIYAIILTLTGVYEIVDFSVFIDFSQFHCRSYCQDFEG